DGGVRRSVDETAGDRDRVTAEHLAAAVGVADRAVGGLAFLARGRVHGPGRRNGGQGAGQRGGNQGHTFHGTAPVMRDVRMLGGATSIARRKTAVELASP